MLENKKILSLKVRTASGNFPKYFVIRGGECKNFTLGDSKKFVFVLESELDALLLYEKSFLAGFSICVIATGGTNKNFDYRSLEKIKAAENLFFVPDNDTNFAGYKAYSNWKKSFPDGKVMAVIGAKDLCEMEQKSRKGDGYSVSEWIRAVCSYKY